MPKPNLKIAVSFSLVVALAMAVVGGERFWRLVSFAHNKKVGVELIESLRSKCPPDVSAQKWDSAINWTRTAYDNVFFSVDSVATDEVAKFTSEASKKFAKEVGIETLDWVWERLAQTGLRGKNYVARFRPEYRAVYFNNVNSEPQ
ncbi:hypothetical protein [Aureliella helgolandensis]|uniref:Uncharacterized protein n=1 Tax=Aureliella helgolandensis TaxID=2527968 RepID=A0A518G3B0_9BACT|nr:hypothetical protein [Aureliella helgolandensis]QDV23097.1 hypothetical protein Q31a_13920 [Aureliella helgolandensis]